MKSLICCVLFLLAFVSARSQVVVSNLSVSPSVITINARLIGKDSVIIPYDSDYLAVPDPCTKVIRYGHYDFKNRYFFGKFKDVSSKDTNQIVAEGSFTKEGLKDGAYVVNYLDGKLHAKGSFVKDKYNGDWIFYYPNGNLQAKGTFKDGKYIGSWEMYYDTGKPQIFFKYVNGTYKINNAWIADGTKVIDNGKGFYRNDQFGGGWNGKLVNGLPDSVWVCVYNMGQNNSPSVIEYFENNQFVWGRAKLGEFVNNYKDESHIFLFSRPPYLEINGSAYLNYSASDCNGKTYSAVKIFGKKVMGNTIYLSGSAIKRN